MITSNTNLITANQNAISALEAKVITLHDKIVVRDEKGKRIETTVGRIIFNEAVRKALA